MVTDTGDSTIILEIGKGCPGFHGSLPACRMNVKPVIFLGRQRKHGFLQRFLHGAQNFNAGTFFFSPALFVNNMQ